MALAELDTEVVSGGEIDPVNARQLGERIHAATRRFAGRLSLTCSVSGGPEHVIPDAVARAMEASAVQAVENISRHSHAERCTVRTVFSRNGRGWKAEVRIDDDGRGFDPSAVPAARLGIRLSIRDRMAQAGGSARVDSEPGSGTGVRLLWETER